MKTFSPKIILPLFLLCCFWLPKALTAAIPNGTPSAPSAAVLTFSAPSATITPALTLAEDFCTDPTDLGTCGSSIPGSPNTITAGPGEPLYINYKVTNTGQSDIVNSVIDDSQFGDDVASSPFTFQPGLTAVFRILADAPTVPGTYNVTATYTGTDTGGNTVVVTGTYTIIVPQPMATITPALTLAEDFCTDPTDLGTCGSSIPGDPNTITAGPGEPLYINYKVTNTGQSDIVNSVIDDSQFGDDVASSPFTFQPGLTAVFRILADAPTVPGTYNVTATYTGTDAGGNTVVVTGTYTIIVPQPMATITPALTLAEDFCTDPTDLGTCGSSIPGDPNTITAGPGEPLYITYRVTNTGQSDIVNSVIDDSQFGDDVASSPFTFQPGLTAVFRILADAPTVPGTYNVTATYTGTDAGGNTVVVTGTYTIIVPQPMATITPALTLAEDFCTDPTDLGTCGPSIPGSPNTITAGPGEPLYINYKVTNTGQSDIVNSVIDDSQFGDDVASSPFTFQPGLTAVFRILADAPTVPGTYNVTATYTGTDAGGNTVVVTGTYTIIVPEPMATIDPAIIAANDFCTDPEILTSCGVGIPGSQNTVTIGAGEPVYLEFAATNTGLSTLVFSEIEDTQFGIIRSGPSSIGPGTTATFRSLQTAPFTPGTYDVDVTYTGRDGAANEVTVTGTYTIIVPEPSATLDPAIIAAEDFCTDPTNLSSCSVGIPGSQNTVTIPAGEPVYLEFAVTNTGLSTLVFSEIEDTQFGIIRSGPSSIGPGTTATFRSLQTAPFTPGTYDVDVTYTGRDGAANEVTVTGTYTIIVEGPNATLGVAVGDGDDFCSDESNIATCTSLPSTVNNLISLVPNEAFLIEYEIENTGTTDLVEHIINDDAYGTAANNTLLTLPPGQAATFRQLFPAPATPGAYFIAVTYEGTDTNGETIEVTNNYILEVLDFDVNFKVAVANASSICTNPGSLSTCGVIFPDQANTASVPPGAPIYLEYQITEVSEVPIVLHTVVDNTYGNIILNDPFVLSSPTENRLYQSLQNAPTTPGIYDYTATYTGEDDDGNQIMREATYTIIVGCPEECFIQGPSGTVCPGTYEFSADFDATICTSPTVDWTVTDAAGGTQTYTGNPVMIPLDGCAEDYTVEATVSCQGCPEPAICTTTVRTEDTTPPVVECTTVEVTFDACPDGIGPNTPNGEWIAVGPTGTLDLAFGGIFTFNADVNDCLSDNCTELAQLEYTLNESYVEASTPGCSLTLISELKFRDKCGNVSADLLIVRGTIEESNPGPPTVSCPADVSISCLESTDPSNTGMATGSSDCGEVTISFTDASVPGCGNTEVITRTWTATNGCGLTASCDQVITVESVEPTISCPAEITIDCSESTDPSNTGTATGTDPCGGMVTITSEDVFVPGCSAVTGTITRTWTATNECGLSTSCEQTITIIDNTAPVFDLACQIDATYTTENGAVCPADATISLSEGDELTVDDGWTVGGIPILPLSGCVSDDCSTDDELTITVDDITVVDEGTCSRTITVTFIADDGCGNFSEPFVCNYTFIDNTAPLVSFNGIPDGGTYVIECDLPSTTWDPLIDISELTITDNCSDINFAGITEVLTQLYDGPCVGNVLTRWQQVFTVMDVCGNTTVYTLFTEIIDTTPPVFETSPADVTIECDETAPLPELEAFDSCSEVDYNFTEVRTDGSCPNNYTLTRTWTATDGCGNASSEVQIVTVEDTTAPVIEFVDGYINQYVSGQNVFVECSELGNISQIIANNAVATDNCSGNTPVTYQLIDLGSFDCAEFGYSGAFISRWFTVDECGNAATASINWFLVDESAPTFQNLPDDTCADADDLPPVANVQAVDDCESASLTFSQSDPIDCDGGGQYIERTWTAEDACGNVATHTQRITLGGANGLNIVIDYPEIGDVEDGDLIQLPIDCDQEIGFSLADLEAAISVADGCGGNSGQPTIEINLMDEGDCAENGYLARYQVNVSATDACGNMASLGIMIDFVDQTGPVVSSPNELTLNCGDDVPMIEATDACGEIASMTFVDSAPIEASCPDNPVAYDRTWTVTDACGNATTFTQSIILLDNNGPVFRGVPSDMCNNTGIDVVVTAVDGCTGQQAQVFFDEVMSSESGCGEVLTRTWTATDACGNTSVATQQVFFDDNEAPAIEFTSDLLFGLESGDELFLTVGDGLGDPGDPLLLTADDVTVTDNCATLTAEVLVETTLSNNCAADGYLARYDYKFIATDPCGNTSSANLTVFYVDGNAPNLLNVPDDVEVICAAIPAVADVTASDDYDEEVEVIFSETQVATAEGVLITRTWTATDKCGNTNAVSQEILVVDNDLDATFSFGGPVIECNSDNNRLGVTPTGGTPPYTYDWELTFPLEDGYITTDPTFPSILFTMGYITQTFTVNITDANGCEYAASVTVVCDFSDDEGDFTGGSNEQLSLNVYPNPVNDLLMLKATGLNDAPVTVALYNLFGQELSRTEVDRWTEEGLMIDTRRFPNGTYLLRLTADGQEAITREVVILH